MRDGGSTAVAAGRRTTVLLVVFAVAVFAATICALTVAREARADRVRPGQVAYVDVQAATLWTNPYQARSGVDRLSYSNPTNLTAWASRMSQSQKGWLIGKTQTQALYGDPVRVLDTYGVWAKVAVVGQRTPKHRAGYPGWVPMRQLSSRPAAIGNRAFVQVRTKHALLYDDRALRRVAHSVSFGTRLAVTGRVPGKVRVQSPRGHVKWMSLRAVEIHRPGRVRAKARPTPAKVVRRAAMFQGTPYIWAGTSSYGFDCSGFTHQIYRSFGVDIPRDAGDQRNTGRVVRGNLRAGDLMFFGSSAGNITHVAMYFGPGRIIHAPFGGSRVMVENINSSGLMRSYQGSRRYI